MEENTFGEKGGCCKGSFQLGPDHALIPPGFSAKSQQRNEQKQVNLPLFLKPLHIFSRIPASDPENLAKTRNKPLSSSSKITAMATRDTLQLT